MPGWTRFETEEGKRYYQDDETGTTQWEAPEEHERWKTQAMDSGTAYYYNVVTDETSWDDPQRDVEDGVCERPQQQQLPPPRAEIAKLHLLTSTELPELVRVLARLGGSCTLLDLSADADSQRHFPNLGKTLKSARRHGIVSYVVENEGQEASEPDTLFIGKDDHAVITLRRASAPPVQS